MRTLPVFAASLIAVFSAATAHAGEDYVLLPVASSAQDPVATGLNDDGTVVGVVSRPEDGLRVVFTQTGPSAPIDLLAPPSLLHAQGAAISNDGYVAAQVGAGPYRWTPFGAGESLDFSNTGQVSVVSDTGIVGGFTHGGCGRGGCPDVPTVWLADGTRLSVPLPDGWIRPDYGTVADITEDGMTAVGHYYIVNPNEFDDVGRWVQGVRAFRWTIGSPQVEDLGPLGARFEASATGTLSIAATNLLGEIAGTRQLVEGGPSFAFLRAADGSIVSVPCPEGCTANDLDDWGTVYGSYSVNGEQHAFLFNSADGLVDLDAQVNASGMTLVSAIDVNGYGDLLVEADASGVQEFYVLKTVQTDTPFSFETPWACSGATQSFDEGSDGGQSMQTTEAGYISCLSQPFTCSSVAVDDKVLLDVWIPSALDPFWVGDIGFHVTVASRGINNEWIGLAQLTGLPREQWVTVSVDSNQILRDALSGTCDDAQLVLAINASGPGIAVDNLRFGQ